MKKIYGRILKGCLLALFLAALLPCEARAERKEIPCGKKVTGTLDTETGLLVISGKGPMWNNPSREYFGPYQEQIKEVVIQEGVTTIGDYAFYSGFDLLQKVTIGKDVHTIGKRSFAYAEGLTDIYIPGTVREIRYEAFQYSGLISCTISPGVEIIGARAFGDTKLETINIPGTVKEIGEGLFQDSALTSCVLNPGLGVIGKEAFSGTSLTSVDIPGTVKEIKEGAFRDNGSLAACTFHPGLSVIGSHAFANTGLTSVILPEGVTLVGSGAFLIGTLREVEIPRSVQIIQSKAFSVANINVLSPTVALEDEAFAAGSYLTADRGTTTEAYVWKTPGRYTLLYRQYEVTMTLDPNGGTVGNASRVVRTESFYRSLPEAKRRGYLFAGWYTLPEGGYKVSGGDRITFPGDFTLYAHWKKAALKACKKPVVRSGSKGKLRVKIRKVSGAVRYQIRVSQKPSMKPGKTILTGHTSRNISRLKSGKKYYVQVRGYCLDSMRKRVYGPWSKKASAVVR
ncbi:MAG: leucine-rich repeat protein [Eubacteriales bacterium]|nr:leucine-rich repeat protein [Eubacteriales bacterium]